MKYLFLILPLMCFSQVWEVPNGTYSNAGSDDTVVWYDMIRDANVAGIDTIKISGTWQLGGAGRFAGFKNGLVIELLEDALITTISSGDLTGLDGNNCKCWTTVDGLVNNYPNRTGGGAYWPTAEGYGPFWFGPNSDVIIVAYGATIEGNYPGRNQGSDPAGSGTNNTFEKYHGFQLDRGNAGNETDSRVEIYGGTWQKFSGDGINLFRSNGYTVVKNVLARWNKRLGVSLVDIEGQTIVENVEVFQNGRGPDGEFGTNTRHGITLEPENPASEYDDITFRNIRAVENADANIGLHIWYLTTEAGVGINNTISITFDGVHLEGGSTTADNTPSAAIHIGGTDAFNDGSKGGNSTWADDSRSGLVSFTNYAIWGDHESGIFTRTSGGPAISFDEGVIYKVDYTGDETSLGLGPVILQALRNGSTPTMPLANHDYGDLTIINTGRNDAPINLVNYNNYTTIASSVTGNITSDDSWSGATMNVTNYTGATNNSTFSESAFPGTEPTVSISVVDNNLAESDLSTARVRFTRTGSTAFPMAVHYTVSTTGTAVQMHNNFELLRGSVVIPVGSETVDEIVTPIRNNGVTDGSRSITLTITDKPDLYTVGTRTGTVYLTDTPEAGGAPVPAPSGQTKSASAALISH